MTVNYDEPVATIIDSELRRLCVVCSCPWTGEPQGPRDECHDQRCVCHVAVNLCRVSGCGGDPARPGSARGFCIRHYTRWLRNGMCEAAAGCVEPATSHLGLCDDHTPEGLAS